MGERVQMFNDGLSEEQKKAIREMYITGLQDEEVKELNLNISNKAIYAEEEAENTTNDFLN